MASAFGFLGCKPFFSHSLPTFEQPCPLFSVLVRLDSLCPTPSGKLVSIKLKNQQIKIMKNDKNDREQNYDATWNAPSPEPWPDPVDANALLDEIAALLRRFVVLRHWGADTVALWALHTYAFPQRDVSVYLGIESPEKRCGKTTLLSVLAELVHRPVVAANISSPAFFRVIAESRPTLLIDEADTFLQGNDELRGILNSGYHRKTAYVVRVANQSRGTAPVPNFGSDADDSGGSTLAKFSCWCPKAVAAIGRLPDTLADRCIVLRMQRKTPGEQCERLRNLDTAALRRKCARFVSDNSAAIADARPEIPAALNDRAADIWEPLLVLADLAGGHWPDLARKAAQGLTASAQESNPIAALFIDILSLLVSTRSERIFSRSLVAGLNRLADRPWAEIRKGKEITEHWLARQLRPYGIQPRTLWQEEISAKGYEMEDFKETFRRYIPRTEIDAMMAALQPPPAQPIHHDHSPAE